ncbi:NUDIX hydrolase [Acidihalobacter yilgarnensis]|uniref:NUDIX hydrolase n=1 Tax=Acidihalobacter yilgarnensis TaxID=2819280 RepID=A0A1D8ILC9_9GAMM|nr:NUDIX domain-containing protein [Acidihalobacter yilgarnensis]AOU97201.1 NUDIX hydrolase [Acidihalobacter yilgarnensis]
MAFEDLYRLSAHAVITDDGGRILMLKADYADYRWGLPGGAVDPGETLIETLVRECREELACEVEVAYLSGIYYHAAVNSHSAIYRARLHLPATIMLSDEHSEWGYFPPETLSPVQRQRVMACLNFCGEVAYAAF